MNRPALMKIIRVDDLMNLFFDEGPNLWNRWEIQNRPILYKEDYGTDDCVIEDIKKAKSLSDKFIPEEEMFQPRQVASCLISLLVRVIPIQLGWTPVFEKESPSARMKYIEYPNWVLTILSTKLFIRT